MVEVVSKCSFLLIFPLSCGLLSHILFSSFIPTAAAWLFQLKSKKATHTLCRQTNSPSGRLRFTPSKQTDMCFICRRGTKALYLVTGAASSSILPSGKLTNYTPLFISKKKNKTKQQQKATKKPNKQLSIFIFLLLPPNTSCISTV